MEHTWRWFGPKDAISLAEIRQAGATGIVTALHDVPNDQVWPVAAIRERKELIEAAGLSWSVVESVPVHEAIKKGLPERDALIDTYCQTLRNLAACGIDTVCYNFMPVLDWTRTDLTYALPDGALALRFDQVAFAAFDLYLLQRPGAEEAYSDEEREQAARYLEGLDEAGRNKLVNTLIAGLPGAEEHYTLEQFRTVLEAYTDIDAMKLRENLGYFLKAVIPVAEEVGIRMAIHPDDPPRPLLGLPRVVSCADDVGRMALPSALAPMGFAKRTTWWRWRDVSLSISILCIYALRSGKLRMSVRFMRRRTWQAMWIWWRSFTLWLMKSVGAKGKVGRAYRCARIMGTTSSMISSAIRHRATHFTGVCAAWLNCVA